MPKQSVFVSEGKTHSVELDGSLIASTTFDGYSTIVSGDELEAFVSWLTDEANSLKSRRAEAGLDR